MNVRYHSAMPYRFLGLPLALGVLLFAIVYGLNHQFREPTSTLVITEPAATSTQADILPPLDEQLGRLFVVGHWADTPVASTTALISTYHLGGVIIMSAPEDPSEISAWTAEWQAAVEYPLLIAIDQEGGEVSRLKGADYTQTAQPIITTREEAYEVGLGRGAELATLGINTNLAPVVEQSTNPNSFLYQRVFRDPDDIASLTSAMLDGFRENNIIGVIKHYPGHPDGPADSHVTLPIVNLNDVSFSEYTSQFNELIANEGISILMTAHVLVPTVDDDYSATLSHTILTQELRQKQGYEGVIVTDDMTMDAIDTKFSTTEATKLALQAGADLIMFAAEPSQVESVIPAIFKAIEASELPANTITEHYRRVESLFIN